MSKKLRSWLAGAGVASFLIVSLACGSPTGNEQQPRQEQAKLNVVATTALLADMVRSIGGNLVEVSAIVPAGADAHAFQPSPADSVAVNGASLLVSNGGDLDRFLTGMLESAAALGTVRVAASLGLAETDQDEDVDPHFWQNPVYAIHYARLIRDGLSEADPINAATYAAGTDAYVDELTALDQEIARLLEQVPPEKRHIFSFHDAFGHFANRYGWTVNSLVYSDAGDITPNDIVELIQLAAAKKIAAVFAEPQFGPGILERAAEEAGVKVGVIYSDALDDQVTSYIEMMRFNAGSLAKHLK